MMTIEDIMTENNRIQNELKYAAATMEKKSTIPALYKRLQQLQAECPHYSAKYNLEIVNNKCPYCGKEMR